jgi:hypothetical protein
MNETNPTTTPTERLPWEDEDDSLCIKCKTKQRRATSDYCDPCFKTFMEPVIRARVNGKEPEKKEKCYRQNCGCGLPHVAPLTNGKAAIPEGKCHSCRELPLRDPNAHYCADCYKKVLVKFKIEDDRRIMFANGELCPKCGVGAPDEGERLCYNCLNHDAKRVVTPKLSLMPESCMYGWLGDFVCRLQCPPSAAYPAVLAVAAGYGVVHDQRVRTTLYTNHHRQNAVGEVGYEGSHRRKLATTTGGTGYPRLSRQRDWSYPASRRQKA